MKKTKHQFSISSFVKLLTKNVLERNFDFPDRSSFVNFLTKVNVGFLVFGIFLYFASPIVAQTSAANQFEMTVFPPTAYLIVKPGTTITHRVLVRYDGDRAVNITPRLLDFTADGTSGTPQIKDSTSAKFINLQNLDKDFLKPFAMQPHSQVELVLEISPAAYESNGEYPLTLLLQAEPLTNFVLDGSQAQTSGAVASNVIISVQRDFENQGELEVSQVQVPRFIDSFGHIDFDVLAKNVGRNAVAAGGEIKLQHAWSNKELAHWFIHPDVILADNTRQLRTLAENPQDLELGEDFEFTERHYQSPFMLGPYEISVQLTSANQDENIIHQRNQRVIALPFSLFGAILLGLAIFFGYTRWEQSQQKKY